MGKKTAQQNTQLSYNPSFWTKVSAKLFQGQGEGGNITPAQTVQAQKDFQNSPIAKAGEFVAGAGKYIGNKVVQAGEAIFKGGK